MNFKEYLLQEKARTGISDMNIGVNKSNHKKAKDALTKHFKAKLEPKAYKNLVVTIPNEILYSKKLLSDLGTRQWLSDKIDNYLSTSYKLDDRWKNPMTWELYYEDENGKPIFIQKQEIKITDFGFSQGNLKGLRTLPDEKQWLKMK